MMSPSSQTSTSGRVVFIDYLKFIAIFLVMIVHASESAYSDGTVNFVFHNTGDHFWIAFISGMARCSVPLFLMASAYLLLPLTIDGVSFFKKRLVRVVIPFVIWLLLYAFVPFFLGQYDAVQLKEYLGKIWYNTIPPANHLWFVYMFIGLTMLMPVLSAWLRTASRRGERAFLAVWLVASAILLIHSRYGYMFGEMPGAGYEYGVFYYFSGYVGYLVLGHYLRTYVDWSPRKTLCVALPLWIVGFTACFYSFYTRSFTAQTVGELELGWNNSGTAVLLMTCGLFLLVKKINCSKGFIYKAVKDVAQKSYGMYLVHMMFLPYIFSWLRPQLNTPLTIVCTALLSYVVSFTFVKLLSFIPGSKYIVG